MAAISDYLEAALLNHVFRNTAMTSPTTVYLALYTAAPSDAGGGTEVTGNGYAREAITFGAPSAGQVSNSAEISFTASGGKWGTITPVGIFEAITAGNLLYHGALTTSRIVNDTDTLTFAVGELDCSLD